MTLPHQQFSILIISELSRSPEGRLRERPSVSISTGNLDKFTNAYSFPGIARLADAASPFQRVRAKIWAASKTELLRDIQRAARPEASLLYKRVFLEGLLTFGAQPVGLIVADFYLGSGPEESDLAIGLQNVAAQASAPVLVGVSPNFDPASAIWLAVANKEESRFLFPLRPRWRGAARRDDGQSWMHPGYLVAARVAAAMREAELADATANMFPGWSSGQAAGFAATAGDILWDVQFESEVEESDAGGNAGPQGANAISAELLGRKDALASLVPASALRSEQGNDNLAHLLLRGQLHHLLLDHVRRRHSSDSGSALIRIVREWFSANTPMNQAEEPLLTLRNVGIARDKLRVAVGWHKDAGGFLEEIEITVPGILDDRVPRSQQDAHTDKFYDRRSRRGGSERIPLRKDLLNPIPGPDRAGNDMRYSLVFDKIREARRSEDDYSVSQWTSERKTPDWPLTIALIQETLASRTKDLWLVAWLAEAMLRTGGLSAFRETLDLARALIQEFWNDLYPSLEEGNAEVRAAPLLWIGRNLASAIIELPLTNRGFDLNDYKQALLMGAENSTNDPDRKKMREAEIRDGKIPIEVFEADVDATAPQFYHTLKTELNATLDALAALDKVTAGNFRDDRPDYVILRLSLEDVRAAVYKLQQRKNDLPVPTASQI
jgi:type VI secretion system ImpA family protein